MEYLKIVDWDEWQTFRKDRGNPDWIKVYRNLRSNWKWAALDDAERGQLVAMWILAADRNGEIPNDPKVIKNLCMMSQEPNLNRFKELQLIDGQVVTTWLPPGNQVVTDRVSRVEESRVEKKERENIYGESNSPSGLNAKQKIKKKKTYDIEYEKYPDFCQFWELFPKKKSSKYDAFKEWKKLSLEGNCEKLIENMKLLHETEWAKPTFDVKYLKDGNRWLKSMIWMQKPEEQEKTNGQSIDWSEIEGLDLQNWQLWVEYLAVEHDYHYNSKAPAFVMAQYPEEVQQAEVERAIGNESTRLNAQWMNSMMEKSR